jgi:hypothetical protein
MNKAADRAADTEIALTEESHNHIDWEVRTPVVWYEVGLLVGALFFAVLAVLSPSPLRWQAIGLVGGLLLIAAVALAVTTPMVDRGHLERLPEGGEVRRSRVWLFLGERPVLAWPLDDVVAFQMEGEIFEDVSPTTYRLARLWVVSREGDRRRLTQWASPASVRSLGEALGKAGRRAFEHV